MDIRVVDSAARVEHLIFHFDGKEYTIFDALTPEEVGAIIMMAKERDKKLRPLDAKSTRRYFEDTDRMIATILRRCFHITDEKTTGMDEMQRRHLVIAFIIFMASANDMRTDFHKP